MTKAQRRPAPPPIRTAAQALELLVELERQLFAEGDHHRHLQLIRLHVWISNLTVLAGNAVAADGRHRADLLVELLTQLPMPEAVKL